MMIDDKVYGRLNPQRGNAFSPLPKTGTNPMNTSTKLGLAKHRGRPRFLPGVAAGAQAIYDLI